jgi:CheY-like chemotaxis protein
MKGGCMKGGALTSGGVNSGSRRNGSKNRGVENAPAPLAVIVDDSPLLLLQLQLQLVTLGFGVTAVTDAARLPAPATGAAVVFIELQLMQANGFRLTRLLARCCSCPLILLTGTGRRTDLQWGLRAGACAVLKRPVRDSELRAVLQTLPLCATAA